MKKLSFLAVVVLLAFLITSCTPTPTPSPTPTPTAPPTGTTAPSVTIVRDGGWTGKIIQNGDPVRFNRDIYFKVLLQAAR
jgi:PBP1b-binding outer membrane lipoprotein LpoB